MIHKRQITDDRGLMTEDRMGGGKYCKKGLTIEPEAGIYFRFFY